MRLALLTSLAAAILVAGCGRTRSDSTPGPSSQAGAQAAGGDQSGGGAGAGTPSSAGSGGGETLCPGAGWPSASDPVAVGFSGADVVLVGADGARRLTATLGQAAGVGAEEFTMGTRRIAAGVLAWAEWPSPSDPDQFEGETLLLDRGGDVIWQLPGVVQNAWSTTPTASTAGMVAAAAGGQAKLVQANGAVSTLPLGDYDSIDYVGDVGSDGWFAARWWYSAQGGQDWHYGFLNLDGRPPQELSANPALTYVSSYQGQAYYLTGPSSLTLHLETPAEARSIALGTDAPAASSFAVARSASRFVVAVDQRLVQTVDPVSGMVSAVDSAAIDTIVGTVWYQVAISSESDFAIAGDYDAPRFLFDARSGAVEPVRLDLLAPLEPLDSPYCGSILALDDGRIGLGLRDSALAGFYVGKADSTGFERLGLPFRNVTAINAVHVAQSWVITGVSGIDSYCIQFQPFTEPSPDDAALEGDVVQIVAPGAPPLVLPEPAPAVALDETGLCALATWPKNGPTLSETRLYDVTSGTSTRLDGLTNVIWL